MRPTRRRLEGLPCMIDNGRLRMPSPACRCAPVPWHFGDGCSDQSGGAKARERMPATETRSPHRSDADPLSAITRSRRRSGVESLLRPCGSTRVKGSAPRDNLDSCQPGSPSGHWAVRRHRVGTGTRLADRARVRCVEAVRFRESDPVAAEAVIRIRKRAFRNLPLTSGKGRL